MCNLPHLLAHFTGMTYTITLSMDLFFWVAKALFVVGVCWSCLSLVYKLSEDSWDKESIVEQISTKWRDSPFFISKRQIDSAGRTTLARNTTPYAQDAVKRNGTGTTAKLPVLYARTVGNIERARPANEKSDWRKVLGLNPGENDIEVVKYAFRKKAMESHPDRNGGDDSKMKTLNIAMHDAGRDLSKKRLRPLGSRMRQGM